MYKLVFSSQQPKAKNFRKHCCDVMFPQIRQQLGNKMKEEHQQAITDCCNRDNVLIQSGKNGKMCHKAT